MPTDVPARVLGVLVVAILGAGVFQCLQFARADLLFQQDTGPDIRQAIALAPGDAHYHARLSAFLDDRSAVAELRRAAALDPLDSSVWIDLGLRAETAGDGATAEADLLRAAQVDRTYTPRWSLAGFYYRRGAQAQFWRWARRAAEMQYYNLTGLFRLCWGASQDSGAILRRAIPDIRPVRRQYVIFLAATDRLAAAQEVARTLAGTATEEDCPALLDVCDRLLAAGDGDGAAELWDRLAARGLVAGGLSFTRAPSSRGFDWRTPGIEGVVITRARGGLYLRVSFSGDEPEECEPLWRYVRVQPGRGYRWSYEYRTEGVAPEAGLEWRASGGAHQLAESAGLSADEWRQAAVSFTSPPDAALCRLALSYRRAPGTTRMQGAVSLRNIRLESER